MKKLDLKSMITLCLIITICIGFILTLVAEFHPKLEPLPDSDKVIMLFGGVLTAATTYFFVRQKKSEEAKDE